MNATRGRHLILAALYGAFSLSAAAAPAPAPAATSTRADALEPARAALRTLQFDKAVALLRVAGDAGNADAQYMLGLIYLNGVGVAPDAARARKLLEAAADHGQGAAAYVLAAELTRDRAAPPAAAREWLQRSAKLGYDRAVEAVRSHRPLLDRESVGAADPALAAPWVFYCVRRNDVAELRRIGRVGASVRDEFGRPALSYAAADGALPAATALLALGADVQAVDKAGTTALMIAAARPDAAMTELLLRHGAKTETVDQQRRTALFYAARAEQPGQHRGPAARRRQARRARPARLRGARRCARRGRGRRRRGAEILGPACPSGHRRGRPPGRQVRSRAPGCDLSGLAAARARGRARRYGERSTAARGGGQRELCGCRRATPCCRWPPTRTPWRVCACCWRTARMRAAAGHSGHSVLWLAGDAQRPDARHRTARRRRVARCARRRRTGAACSRGAGPERGRRRSVARRRGERRGQGHAGTNGRDVGERRRRCCARADAARAQGQAGRAGSRSTHGLVVCGGGGVRRGGGDALAAGANPQVADTQKVTALHAAAAQADAAVFVPLLAADKASLNRLDAHGDTPLLIAAATGHLDVVKALLAQSPKLDLQNDAGDTALIAASRGGYRRHLRAVDAGRGRPVAAQCERRFGPRRRRRPRLRRDRQGIERQGLNAGGARRAPRPQYAKNGPV